MKYRIREYDGKFYPQYRRFFTWFNFEERCYNYYIDVEYYSLHEAKNYLDNKIKHIKIKSEKPIEKIHKYKS